MSDESKCFILAMITVAFIFLGLIGAATLNSHLNRQFKYKALDTLKDKIELKINTKDLVNLLK